MKTSGDFRAAAANCQLLADAMCDPDHARKLRKLVAEFAALAEAEDAAGSAANRIDAQRRG